jgi:hypothetical protein
MENLQVSSEVLVGFGLLLGSFATIGILLIIETFKTFKH